MCINQKVTHITSGDQIDPHVEVTPEHALDVILTVLQGTTREVRERILRAVVTFYEVDCT